MNERAALIHFLDAQREVVIEIVDGLDATAMGRTPLPSGWSPASMLHHLADAESYWFGEVIGDSPLQHSDSERERLADPIDDYRAQVVRSRTAIRGLALDAPTTGTVVRPLAAEITNLRTVMFHMIEETARHAGHLDVARELIDGRTGRGPR